MSVPSESIRALLTRQTMSEPLACMCSAGSVMLFSRGKPQREHDNQDATCFLQLSKTHAVLAIADGVGGQRRGAEAAALTLQWLADAIVGATQDSSKSAIQDAIIAGLHAINQELLDSHHGGASTVAVVEVNDRTVRPYHVGDSEILVVGQRGKVRLDVVPHSPVGYAVEAGLLARAEAIHHINRHLVSNVVGSKSMHVDVGETLTLQRRDTLLLGTDGLFDNMHLEEIVDHIRKGTLQSAAASLVQTCFRRMNDPQPGLPSKPDDLTFILFRPHS